MNRLKTATSPYLLQHAGNPVDWWPWCDEAFAEARRRDVPVLLSVGYAACHWCHVMAHESFEDPATAAVVNENMVAIKVDREERPDIDAVYMAATTAMNRGQGGWPMTVFMTPDGEPFFCGTYFPRAQFTRLVTAIGRAWREDKERIRSEAERISLTLRENAAALSGLGAGGGELPLAEMTSGAVAKLAEGFDRTHGGFGSAPKFPPSMVLEFLLRHHRRTGSPQALSMAVRTCEAMARGGMYDQLGGGFARYSVDAAWVVPHFEKMLYDNALLARVYAHLWVRTGSELARRVAEETCEFMLRELRTPEGGFAASLDADSEGGEGAFYVWTPDQLRKVLGEADGEFAAEAFGVTEQGTFEHGTSVLQRRSDPADRERLDRIRGELLAARDGRPRPARDDKVVAAWNGMAIAALAEAGMLFGRPDLLAAAADAAELLAAVHVADGRILRTSRDGVAGPSAGLLEDYACVASGLLVLHGMTGRGRWVPAAGALLDTLLAAFGDGSGGFYDTADDGERLIFRPADPADGATPSGTFAAADALLGYAALSGSARHRDAAVAALRVLPPIAARYPRAAGMGLSVAEALLSGPAEIAIVGPDDDPRTLDLLRTALHAAPPGAVFAMGSGEPGAPGGSGADGPAVPLLAGRGLAAGAPTAYVCRGFACQAPVTSTSALRETLSRDWTAGRSLGIVSSVHLTDGGRRVARAIRRGGRPGRPAGLRRQGLRQRERSAPAGNRRLLPAGVAALAAAGTLAGAMAAVLSGAPGGELAAAGAGGTARGSLSPPPEPGGGLPEVRPVTGNAPVVPALALGAGAHPLAAPAVPAVRPATGRPPAVAPLRRTLQADLLIVAPFSLPRGLAAAVSRLPGVTAAEQIEAVRMRIDGAYTSVLGVDPSVFRTFAARPTGASDALWEGVASGGVAVSYTMGKLDRLPLGGTVTAAGRTTRRLPVVAFGTMGIGGVNAVVSDAVARSLGAPAGNAIVVSTRSGQFTADAAAVGRLVPRGASVEQLATLVTAGAGRPGAAGAGAATAGGVPAARLDTMLRAALSRKGMPYIWGAAGPASFDCSGLVQWSFAQAGITMPRVAADQALSGPAVPVSQLRAGDLLFYHTDPTAPAYISHVAIYLGNGWMLQAPEPGMDVEIVPADFGPEFAGAVRVNPAQAAAVAARAA